MPWPTLPVGLDRVELGIWILDPNPSPWLETAAEASWIDDDGDMMVSTVVVVGDPSRERVSTTCDHGEGMGGNI